MPRPSHPPCFDHPTILGEEYKPCSSSLCSFLQPPVTSSLSGPNILLSTLFSNTLNLCSSLNVRDQVSHPYKTTGGKNIIIYIYIYVYIAVIHTFGILLSETGFYENTNSFKPDKANYQYYQHRLFK
jgi:hypothetical protein